MFLLRGFQVEISFAFTLTVIALVSRVIFKGGKYMQLKFIFFKFPP